MGTLDDYSNAAPQGKSMRGNGITTFLFHVAQCIIINQPNRVKTFIANALLKSFYSMLGFKVIKDFANSTNFEEQLNDIYCRKTVKNYIMLFGKTVISLLLMFLCLVMDVVCLSILSFMLNI